MSIVHLQKLLCDGVYCWMCCAPFLLIIEVFERKDLDFPPLLVMEA